MSTKLQLASWIGSLLAVYMPLCANAQSPPVKTSGHRSSNSPQRVQLKNADWEGYRNISLQTIADRSLSQINRVSGMQDISPSDWAYEALMNLVERYDCITGFPNRTYRGELPISRDQFAAALNSCSIRMEAAIAESQAVATEDIESLLRLMQDFQSELAIVRGRTDALEARTTELELTQFSSTTTLTGEVIFGLASVFSGDETTTVFGDRVRLEFNTSFSGRDLLLTRLATGNFPVLDEDVSFEGNLSFSEPANNDLGLDTLYYSFPVGDRGSLLFGATGVAADDFVNTVSILDGDGARGAITAFGTRNPIYQPPGDAGVGIVYDLGVLEFSGGYLAGEAADPDEGIFDSPYSAIAQVLFTPADNLDLAFTYVHSRSQSDTETGSQRANIQSLTTSSFFPEGVPTVSDSYGIELSWAISDRVVIGGWGTLSKVTTLSTLNGTIDRGTQDVWNTALTVALPDLGKEGNLGGVIVGIEPTVTDSTIEELPEDEDFSLHVEAFYQYQINDNISVTPGVVWIAAPDNNADNDDLVIGTIRTTFSF